MEMRIIAPAHLGGIVTSAFLGGVTVVGAAARFFVVELDGSACRFPAPAKPRMRVESDRGRLHSPWSSTTTSRPGEES